MQPKSPPPAKDADFLDGKLKLVAEFPRFLQQRRLILRNPSRVLKPPEDFEGWLSEKEFVRRTIAYVALFAAIPKLILLVLHLPTPGNIDLYIAGVEWLLPLTFVLTGRILTSWLRASTAAGEAQIQEFRVLFLNLVVAKPFWLHLLFGAAAWAWLLMLSTNLAESSAGQLLLAATTLALPLVFLATVTLPMEAASIASSWAKVGSRWLTGISWLVNITIYAVVQLTVWAIIT
jgi:hypothetical protein